MNTLYPKTPTGVSKEYTQPSAQFRKGVRKITFAIILFGIIYLALLAIGVCIAVALAFLGCLVIYEIHNFISLVFGVALIITGLMVLYFLVKFIFENKKDDRSDNLEITEEDYPELFDFIRQLSIDTETDFPKHIYISADVNAAVFYDSNFLSMFFPVRKNLLIGLGIVNSINISEFKAVIAHEFGHFSQKSMRAGSYVYQVNKVIYNMLYENDAYAQLLNKWARVHAIFAVCANIIVKLVKGIQWVQRQAYKMVNKQYYTLSREMEYHADAVSAVTCGSNNAIHALRRIDFGENCYQSVLHKYNEWVPENLKGENLYDHQRIVSQRLSQEYNYPHDNGLPMLYSSVNAEQSNCRVRIDNQWASHPSLPQREKALRKIPVEGQVNNESAWALFGNAKKLQEQFTSTLYTTVKFDGPVITINSDAFRNRYHQQRDKYMYPKVYDQYFSGRKISAFNPDLVIEQPETITDITAFFARNTEVTKRMASMETDIDLLTNISANSSVVRTFIFDEEQYASHHALTIRTTLEAELQQIRETIKQKDIAVSQYFLSLALLSGIETKQILQSYYNCYFKLVQLCEDNLKACNTIVELLRPLYATNTPSEAYKNMIIELKASVNDLIKMIDKCALFLSDDTIPYKYSLSNKLVSTWQKALAFSDNSRLSATTLDGIYEYINEYAIWTIELSTFCQKDLLVKQSTFLPN